MFDDQLLKWKFKRGSDEALTLIYEKYLDSMLTLAAGLLNDTSEAQDVVHDVFISFAKSASDFRVRGSVEARSPACRIRGLAPGFATRAKRAGPRASSWRIGDRPAAASFAA